MKIEKKQQEERSKKAHIDHHAKEDANQEELKKHSGKLNHGDHFGHRWEPNTKKQK